jgi:hypothetical protein
MTPTTPHSVRTQKMTVVLPNGEHWRLYRYVIVPSGSGYVLHDRLRHRDVAPGFWFPSRRCFECWMRGKWRFGEPEPPVRPKRRTKGEGPFAARKTIMSRDTPATAGLTDYQLWRRYKWWAESLFPGVVIRRARKQPRMR